MRWIRDLLPNADSAICTQPPTFHGSYCVTAERVAHYFSEAADVTLGTFDSVDDAIAACELHSDGVVGNS